MRTIGALNDLLARAGSDVTYHREEGGTACPCRTEEGFRDPQYHIDHPSDPLCNEEGFLAVVTEFGVKAAVQPVRMRYNRNAQMVNDLLGSVQRDDRIGIFPCNWNNHALDFDDWGQAGEDYILYDGKRYIVVSADKVPDIDGDPGHHWEVGLRLVGDRPEV